MKQTININNIKQIIKIPQDEPNWDICYVIHSSKVVQEVWQDNYKIFHVQ